MAIETQTAALREQLKRRLNQAYLLIQHIAQNETVTADQAAPVDTALANLNSALVAAGAGVALPATQVIVSNAQSLPVQNSANTAVPGTHNAFVVDGAFQKVKLAATVAPVTSGLLSVAATGTGTKVTLTVANGVVSAVTLSA
uniref:Uncharacterized protein n=3 Tax=unclassified bacterial viruses TaxID=12333 RepID=A0AAU6W0Z5_9VIRU